MKVEHSTQVINKHGTKVYVASERVEGLLKRGFKLVEEDAEVPPSTPEPEGDPMDNDIAMHPPETVYAELDQREGEPGEEGVYLPEEEAEHPDHPTLEADRDAIKAELVELGVKFNSRAHTETLIDALNEAKRKSR